MMWALVTLLLAWLQPSLYTTPARLVDFLLGTTLIASVAVVLSSNYEMNGTGGLIGWLFFAGFASGYEGIPSGRASTTCANVQMQNLIVGVSRASAARLYRQVFREASHGSAIEFWRASRVV